MAAPGYPLPYPTNASQSGTSLTPFQQAEAVENQNAKNVAAAEFREQFQQALNNQLSQANQDAANADILAGAQTAAEEPRQKLLIALGLATLFAGVLL